MSSRIPPTSLIVAGRNCSYISWVINVPIPSRVNSSISSAPSSSYEITCERFDSRAQALTLSFEITQFFVDTVLFDFLLDQCKRFFCAEFVDAFAVLISTRSHGPVL